MAKQIFKDASMQDCYEAAIRIASDNFSEFYRDAGPVGPRAPRSGAVHRNAFWSGFTTESCAQYPKDWMAYAFCRAGKDFRATGAPC
jgi:hypothetical protein